MKKENGGTIQNESGAQSQAQVDKKLEYNNDNLGSTENKAYTGESIVLDDVQQTVKRGVEAVKSGDQESVREYAADLAANILFPYPDHIEDELEKSSWMTESKMVEVGSDPEQNAFAYTTRAYMEFLQGSNRSEVFSQLTQDQLADELERYDSLCAISDVLNNMSPMPGESVKDFLTRAAEQSFILRAASETQSTEPSVESIKDNTRVRESVVAIAANDLEEKRNPVIKFFNKIGPKVAELRSQLLENITEAKINKMEAELVALNNEYRGKGKLSYGKWKKVRSLEQFFSVNNLDYPIEMDGDGEVLAMPILAKVRFMQEIQMLNPAGKKMSQETYLKLIESESVERVINYNEFLEKQVQFSSEFFEENNVNPEYLSAQFDIVLKRMAVFAYDNRNQKTRAQIENYAVFVDQMLKESASPEQQKLMSIMLENAKTLLYANPSELKRTLVQTDLKIQKLIGDRTDKENFISGRLNQALFSGPKNLIQKNSEKLYEKVYTPIGFAAKHLLGEVLVGRSVEAVLTTELLENFPKFGEIVNQLMESKKIGSISDMLELFKTDGAAAKEFLINTLGLKEFRTIARYMLGNNNQRLAYVYAENDENLSERNTSKVRNERLDELLNHFELQDINTLIGLVAAGAGIIAAGTGGYIALRNKDAREQLGAIWSKYFVSFWGDLKPNEWLDLPVEILKLYDFAEGYISKGVSPIRERNHKGIPRIVERKVIDVNTGKPADVYGIADTVEIDKVQIAYGPAGQFFSYKGDVVDFWEGKPKSTQRPGLYFVEDDKDSPLYGKAFYYPGGDTGKDPVHVDRITRRPLELVEGRTGYHVTHEINLGGVVKKTFLIREGTFEENYVDMSPAKPDGNVKMIVTDIAGNEIDPMTGLIIDRSVSANGFALPYDDGDGNMEYLPVIWGQKNGVPTPDPVRMYKEIPNEGLLLVDPTTQFLTVVSEEGLTIPVDDATRFPIVDVRNNGNNPEYRVGVPTQVANNIYRLNSRAYPGQQLLPVGNQYILSSKSDISTIAIGQNRLPATVQSEISNEMLTRPLTGGVLGQPTIVILDPANGLEIDIRSAQVRTDDIATCHWTGYMDPRTGFPVNPQDGKIELRGQLSEGQPGYEEIFNKDMRADRNMLASGIGFVKKDGQFEGYLYNPYTNEYLDYDFNDHTFVRYSFDINNQRFINQNMIDVDEIVNQYNISIDQLEDYRNNNGEYVFQVRNRVGNMVNAVYMKDRFGSFHNVLSTPNFVNTVRKSSVEVAMSGIGMKPTKAPIMKPTDAYIVRDPNFGVNSDGALNEQIRNRDVRYKFRRFKIRKKFSNDGLFQVKAEKVFVTQYTRQLRRNYNDTVAYYSGLLQASARGDRVIYTKLNQPASNPGSILSTLDVEKEAALAMQNAKKTNPSPGGGVIGPLTWFLGGSSREFGKDVLQVIVLGWLGLGAVGLNRMYEIYRGKSTIGLAPNLLEREDTLAQLQTSKMKNLLGDALRFAFGDKKLGLREILLTVALGSSALNGLGIKLSPIKEIADYVNHQSIAGAYRVTQFLVSSLPAVGPFSDQVKNDIRESLIKDLIKDENEKNAAQSKADDAALRQKINAGNLTSELSNTIGNISATFRTSSSGNNNSQNPTTENAGSSDLIQQKQIISKSKAIAQKIPGYDKLSDEQKTNLEAGVIFNNFLDTYTFTTDEVKTFTSKLPAGDDGIFSKDGKKIMRSKLEDIYKNGSPAEKQYIEYLVKTLISTGLQNNNPVLSIFDDKNGSIAGSRYNGIGGVLNSLSDDKVADFFKSISFGQ